MHCLPADGFSESKKSRIVYRELPSRKAKKKKEDFFGFTCTIISENVLDFGTSTDFRGFPAVVSLKTSFGFRKKKRPHLERCHSRIHLVR
jgi:hypothetical protein